MSIHRPLAIAVLLTSLTNPVHADGDASEGRKIAEERCTLCHNIEADGPFKQYPPSFAAIAVYRSTNDIRARFSLPPMHATMPLLGSIMTPENIDNLVAYIVSLENQ